MSDLFAVGEFVLFVVCLCCAFAIPAIVWLLVLSLLHLLSISVPRWLPMVSKLRRGVRGSRVKSGQKETWQVRSRLMGQRSGRAHSVQNRMCGRGCCRRCYSDIPAGLRGKHRQAVAARSGEWSTGSTASSGKEDRKTRSLEAENKGLRARIDALEKKGGEGAQGGQSILQGKKEIWKMCGEEDLDIEDVTESRRKLDEEKRKLQKELLDVERRSLISK